MDNSDNDNWFSGCLRKAWETSKPAPQLERTEVAQQKFNAATGVADETATVVLDRAQYARALNRAYQDGVESALPKVVPAEQFYNGQTAYDNGYRTGLADGLVEGRGDADAGIRHALRVVQAMVNASDPYGDISHYINQTGTLK